MKNILLNMEVAVFDFGKSKS